jgi:TIR domain-containing protein
MATLREYFDTDLSNTIKIYCRHAVASADLEFVILCDFSANMACSSCYVPGEHALDFFIQLVQSLQYGQTALTMGGKVVLPSSRTVPGEMRISNPFDIQVRPYGNPDWISWKQLTTSMRLFIYSESDLSDDEIRAVQAEGLKANHHILFRSRRYVSERSIPDKPLGFISYDSRDREDVARRIATNLQSMMCPVWYDEFSLRVGANLRDSIEAGLKSCKKCILILSENFFSNNGWTKKEFDSIFTREILEQKQLVLPVWYKVTKEMVYEYSPSLLNVKGLDWDMMGEKSANN